MVLLVMHLRFWRRREPQCYVLLTFEEGPPARVGPMTHFAAEVLLVIELANHPFHYKRRVASARIIVE
jgi:hypothetical protein